jgi:hypothetical protein
VNKDHPAESLAIFDDLDDPPKKENKSENLSKEVFILIYLYVIDIIVDSFFKNSGNSFFAEQSFTPCGL